MPDFGKHITKIVFFLLLLFTATKPVFAVKSNETQAQRFDAEKLEEYRNDRDFRYEVNPYRQNTFWDKIRYYLGQFLNTLFSDKGPGPYIRTLILIVVLALAVIKLVDGNAQWFFGKESKSREGTVRLLEEDIAGADLMNLADIAHREGNLRLCIRYHYLHLLKELDAKGFISWHKDKTNRDYLREIRQTDIRSLFQVQTFVFDYVWYGNFEIDEVHYQTVQQGFQNLLTAIETQKQVEV